jgi:hypothetical protein
MRKHLKDATWKLSRYERLTLGTLSGNRLKQTDRLSWEVNGIKFNGRLEPCSSAASTNLLVVCIRLTTPERSFIKKTLHNYT